MTTDKQRATSLLQHYLKFGLEAAGYRWDSDNQSEVADIVDRIIDARNEPTPTTASTPAEPDMIQQAGQLLAMLQAGKPICHGMSASSGDDRAIVQASAALAIAGELRELRNLLAMAMSEGSDANGSQISALRIDTGA